MHSRTRLAEIGFGAMLGAALVAHFAGLQHLLDGSEQAVGILEHELVELLALALVHFPALQRFEVQANGGDGRFQFVGDCVDEAVVLLVAADFAHEEACIQDQPKNDGGEEKYAEEKQDVFAPVENDPADIQRQSERDQANAQDDEKRNLLAAARDSHGGLSRLYSDCDAWYCRRYCDGMREGRECRKDCRTQIPAENAIGGYAETRSLAGSARHRLRRASFSLFAACRSFKAESLTV